MTAIGEYIKYLRESKNYSQRKLGYVAKVSNATINRIEKNISMPDPETLSKLAAALGVSYIKLLNVAGYLDAKKFVPSNVAMIRQKSGMTYEQLADDIKRVTGNYINPETLENLEKGKDEYIIEENINTIAKYKGVDPAFLFRENTPEDFEYATRNFPYKEYQENKPPLNHIKDEQLKKWILNPSNLDYIIFAKKLSDLGIDPDFVLNQFIFKIFKKKKNKQD